MHIKLQDSPPPALAWPELLIPQSRGHSYRALVGTEAEADQAVKSIDWNRKRGGGLLTAPCLCVWLPAKLP